MLFTRAPESNPADHDVYLARLAGGQWNTVERVDRLSELGANDHSVALVESQKTIFLIRNNQIRHAWPLQRLRTTIVKNLRGLRKMTWKLKALGIGNSSLLRRKGAKVIGERRKTRVNDFHP